MVSGEYSRLPRDEKRTSLMEGEGVPVLCPDDVNVIVADVPLLSDLQKQFLSHGTGRREDHLLVIVGGSRHASGSVEKDFDVIIGEVREDPPVAQPLGVQSEGGG
jgi:hypothetical protein